MFEFFHLALAIGPLAVYWIVMGCIRVRSRPMVVSGGRDTFVLAMGLLGVVAIGPMELFFPRAAASILGPKVWLFLLLLYLLAVLLVILASRPRLIVYGLDAEELKHVLQGLLADLDTGTSWLGESVKSPALGVVAIVEKAGPGRISQLLAVHHRQHLPGWLQVERALAYRVTSMVVSDRRAGFFYLVLGLAVLGVAGFSLGHDPKLTMQSMQEMLRW